MNITNMANTANQARASGGGGQARVGKAERAALALAAAARGEGPAPARLPKALQGEAAALAVRILAGDTPPPAGDPSWVRLAESVSPEAGHAFAAAHAACRAAADEDRSVRISGGGPMATAPWAAGAADAPLTGPEGPSREEGGGPAPVELAFAGPRGTGRDAREALGRAMPSEDLPGAPALLAGPEAALAPSQRLSGGAGGGFAARRAAVRVPGTGLGLALYGEGSAEDPKELRERLRAASEAAAPGGRMPGAKPGMAARRRRMPDAIAAELRMSARAPCGGSAPPWVDVPDWASAPDALLEGPRGGSRALEGGAPAEIQSRAWAEAAEVRFGPAPVSGAVRTGRVFLKWRPRFRARIRLEEGQDPVPAPPEHPTPLVRPAALAPAAPPLPPPLRVPASILRMQALSDAQVEAVGMAMGAFAAPLLEAGPEAGQPSPVRGGFLNGDGTGCGKGRAIAATIAACWIHGEEPHRRSLWLSASPALMADALRDWRAIGGEAQLMHAMPPEAEAAQGLGHLGDGVLFASYASIRSAASLRAAADWLSAGGDSPVVVLDECQNLAGAEDTSQGAAALALQEALPRARVLYTSATALSDARSYGFAPRLGLWRSWDSPFRSRKGFVDAVSRAGTAIREAVCRETSLQGRSEVRALSLEGIESRPLRIELDEGMRSLQEVWGKAWQVVSRNLEACLKEATPEERARLRGQTNSVRLGFFSYLMGAFKADRLVEEIKACLARGEAPVIQIWATHEQSLRRRVRGIAERQGVEPHEAEIGPGDDVGPVEDMIEQVRLAFPIARTALSRGSDGKAVRTVVRDAKGRPEPDPMKIAARGRAVDALRRIRRPLPLLDRLVMEFGSDIAEITGRGMRMFPAGGGLARIEGRSEATRRREAEDFGQGRRRILVFSNAGGTGRSFHADPSLPNDARRVHFVAETTFDTEMLVQGLGRTHRTSQRRPPTLSLVSTDLPGERRFVSAAARNIALLGASTRGDRRAQGGAAISASEALDTPAGRDALDSLMARKGRWTMGAPTAEAQRFMDETGLDPRSRHSWRQHMNQFLNQLMTLPPGVQERLAADLDSERLRAEARRRREGTLEDGIGTLLARHSEEGISVPMPGLPGTRITHVTACSPSLPLPDAIERELSVFEAVTTPSIPSASWWLGTGSVLNLAGQAVEHGRFAVQLGALDDPGARRFPCLVIEATGPRIAMASRDPATGAPIPDPEGAGSAGPAQAPRLPRREIPERVDHMKRKRVRTLATALAGSPGWIRTDAFSRELRPLFVLEGRLLPLMPSLIDHSPRRQVPRVRRVHINESLPAGLRADGRSRRRLRTATGILLTPSQVAHCSAEAWRRKGRADEAAENARRQARRAA